MLGAIYIGLSGMNAYSNGLKTISNNVANLDTLGYKSSTVSFSDIFGANAPGLGLTSWAQGGASGNGVSYNPEHVDFTQGSFQQTGGALDFAIDGNGFLVVQNERGATYYTRTGQFFVDTEGYVVNQHGDRLMMLDASNQPVAINVASKMSNPPAATKTISFSQNLSSSSNSAEVPNITVRDSSGAAHTWGVSLTPVAATSSSTNTQWTVTVKDETGATIGTGIIAFNGGISVPGSSSITAAATPAGADTMLVTLDFSNVQSFSSGTTNTLQASKVDGNAVGTLTGATVNDKGELVLNYSNSQTAMVGAIAIADFRTPQQLARVGNGLFRNTVAGDVQYKASGDAGVGILKSGQVESSNVNLTTEFGNLILVQRGFDASSQVISASNDMIQQLFGMRGHG